MTFELKYLMAPLARARNDRNGVSSRSYGGWTGRFVFVK